MRVINVLRTAKRKIARWIAYEVSGFNSVYGKIEKVPGFLKSPHQEYWFYSIARSSPKDATIVEIGSFKGRSTVSFGFGCVGTNRHVYAIDLFVGDNDMYGNSEFIDEFKSNVERCGLSAYVTPIQNHSIAVARDWKKPIDILFIDGSHVYEDVKADFEAFYPYVKKGGVIAFHDIRGMWEGVIKYWAEVKNKDLLIDCGEVGTLGFGTKA